MQSDVRGDVASLWTYVVIENRALTLCMEEDFAGGIIG
jgi:hypothetical protein